MAKPTGDAEDERRSEIVHKNRVFIDKSSYFRMLTVILRDFEGTLQSLVCMSTVLFIHLPHEYCVFTLEPICQ